ncbi:MAG: hypothetical protein EOM24_21725 [Chloroflexia bacterium]|nr:hypothetical protein [Chloroflexia bacterium]
MAKNNRTMSASASTSSSQISQISSRDPEKVSRYYHEAMRDAIKMVQSAEAQRKVSQNRQQLGHA